MKTLLYAFYVVFVLDTHPEMMRRASQRADVYACAKDVAGTDASPGEGLRLMQIAALESGFYGKAHGKKGETGPWQIMPPATSFGAHEALRRMRGQGMVAYVGCRHASDVVVIEGTKTTCQAMIDHRTLPADAYLATHPAPPPPRPETELAAE